MLSAGIALAKTEKNTQFIQYAPTSRILKIWMANQKHFKKKSIASKIASKTHTSMKRAMNNMPYYLSIFKNPILLKHAIKEFEFTEEEIEWIRK